MNEYKERRFKNQLKTNHMNQNLTTVLIILGVLLVHWFADFVLQTDKQAKGKSKNLEDLLSHTATYSLVWFIVISITLHFLTSYSIKECIVSGFGFAYITLFCHTITDYFTSKLNAKLWKEGKVHLFFVSVGFDQFLHYTQLLLTLLLL